MTGREMIRAGISVLILALFGTAYLLHPDNALLVGALISMATLAAQFWLGSTATEHGSADNANETVKAFNAALNASPQRDDTIREGDTIKVERE